MAWVTVFFWYQERLPNFFLSTTPFLLKYRNPKSSFLPIEFYCNGYRPGQLLDGLPLNMCYCRHHCQLRRHDMLQRDVWNCTLGYITMCVCLRSPLCKGSCDPVFCCYFSAYPSPLFLQLLNVKRDGGDFVKLGLTLTRNTLCVSSSGAFMALLSSL